MRAATLHDSGLAGPAPAAQEVTAKAPATTAVLPVGAELEPHKTAAPAAPQGNRFAAWVRAELPGWLLGAVSIGSVLLVWHLATLYRLDFYIRFNNIPTPAQVFDKVVEVNRSAKFLTSIAMSLQRILLGFAVAAVLGVALGILIGRYRRMRQLWMPAMEMFRPIPAIAWVPPVR